METRKPLLKDEDGEEVDVYLYRSMIGSLMYLTSSRPDIIDSNEKKLIQMNKIHTDKNVAYLLTKAFDVSRFQYLIASIGMLNIYSLDYENGEGKLMLLGINLLLLGKVNAARHKLTAAGKVNAARHKLTIAVKTVNGEQQLQALVDGKKIVVTEASVRRDLQLDDEEGMDCLPNAIIFEELTIMGMVKNLDNAGKFLMYPRFIQVFLDNQLEGMSSHKRIYVTPSHTKKIFANMRRQGKDFSRRETPLFPTMVVQAQEEMGEGSAMPTDPHHTPIITQPLSSQPQRKQKSRRSKRKDTEVPQPSDPTNVADEAVNEEPSMQLKELMDFCTKLQQRVLDLENTKTAQAQEITSLKLRVKKLEKKGGRMHPKQERKIHDIDADEDITLENVHDVEMFDVNDLHGDEVLVQKEVPVKEVSAVGKVNTASIATTDKILLLEPSESITTTTIIPLKDKGKVRLARENNEANVALIKEWNDIQAKIETGYELAQRLQAEEQEELTVDEKATLFQQLLEKRRKHFAAKRAEEKRNRPPLRAQQRSIMCTYMKNMAGWNPKDLKSKSFANIQELFDKAFKRVNTFVDFRTELVEGTEMEESSKKAENAKKQKVDDDQEAAKMKELMKIIPDEEEVAVDAIPLATKPPSICGGIYGKTKCWFGSYLIPVEYTLCGFKICIAFIWVEKRYPLTPATITDMLNKKLQADQWNEMYYQLLS
ncbi:hypothetical protein Tco_0250902 [Tanacetum coccineum]